MSLFPCGIIHQVPVLDPERYSNESQERQEIYIYVTALFADSRINGGAEMLIKSSFMDIVYFLCAFSSSEVLGKNTSMWN